MLLSFLRPRRGNVLVTFIVLALPILKEHVQLEEGGIVVWRYIPLQITFLYAWFGDWRAFLLMVGFSLFVYVVVSAAIKGALALYHWAIED
ncbi:hypothetical protein JXB02_05130 [Candidatus Woesearchaeota archaeon]|nr:hypothetical protein [Candidatus Woesearchaeota archaeon]